MFFSPTGVFDIALPSVPFDENGIWEVEARQQWNDLDLDSVECDVIPNEDLNILYYNNFA